MSRSIQDILLHLSLIKNVGAATIEKIVAALGLERLQMIYNLKISELVALTNLEYKRAEYIVSELKNSETLKLLDNELLLASRHNISVITLADTLYPELLKHIYLPPPVLYVKGSFEFLENKQAVALVGSRKADNYGYSVVKMLVPELVNAGYTVVSGGALGIDTAAHQEALREKGVTIAVLGSGLLKSYPAQNKKLFEYIAAQSGALISPFPLLTSPLAGNFPARNRIIAGLSKGCVVVQADKPSGALITAHYALQEGREVFAVPGQITTTLSKGCHYLLSQGATVVEDAYTIIKALEPFNNSYKSGPTIQEKEIVCKKEKLGSHSILSFKNHDTDKHLLKDASVSSKEDVNCLPETLEHKVLYYSKKPIDFDELVGILNISVQELQEVLLNLQLEGKIAQIISGQWQSIC